MDFPEMFKADLPPEFLTNLYHSIRDAYSSARLAVDSQALGADERYNLMPWTRRAHVESRLRDAAACCNVDTYTKKTGFWRHVVATCGRFRVTQTTSIDSTTPIRKAEYKVRYAKEQLLLPFFEDAQQNIEQDAPHLYAVVLHRANVLADEPDFISIRFPTSDLEGFHRGEIDLSLYADLPSSELAVPEEQIDELSAPTLKLRKQMDTA